MRPATKQNFQEATILLAVSLAIWALYGSLWPQVYSFDAVQVALGDLLTIGNSPGVPIWGLLGPALRAAFIAVGLLAPLGTAVSAYNAVHTLVRPPNEGTG